MYLKFRNAFSMITQEVDKVGEEDVKIGIKDEADIDDEISGMLLKICM